MAIVLDPALFSSVEALARTCHVWVVRAPQTENIAERFWHDHQSDGGQWNESGLTLFTGASTPEESLVSILGDVELHHGQYSDDPPLSVIDVLGTAMTDHIREALTELGFTEVRGTDHGFTAHRQI